MKTGVHSMHVLTALHNYLLDVVLPYKTAQPRQLCSCPALRFAIRHSRVSYRDRFQIETTIPVELPALKSNSLMANEIVGIYPRLMSNYSFDLAGPSLASDKNTATAVVVVAVAAADDDDAGDDDD